MIIEELVVSILFLFFGCCFSYFLYEFAKDVVFYAKNGWDLNQIRKESVEIYDGDHAAELPSRGRRRFIGMIIVLIIGAVVLSALFFGGFLPFLKKIL
ncbi:hypothetical protein [uncultured Roseibium sp.]|uniref:hypothetical protein n=1 Tax=uncultured Roseibium sp. TaxID=1936171 RepID=UPI002617F713|nr:hypothetical protein [uncultured Roseibium sp.]